MTQPPTALAPWHDPFWTTPPEPADADAPASDRVQVRRNAARGRYDLKAAHAILDATPLCHLAFLSGGHPMVIPTLQVRIGDLVYIHGSSGSRMGLGANGVATPVTLNVSLVDAMVLARSAFHHSVNHRSVIVVGDAELVTDQEEKVLALDATVDKVVPGRAGQLRPHTARELQATAVMRLPLTEVSVKVRAGWASDEPEDMDADVWAGLLPLHTTWGQPEANPDMPSTRPLPANLRAMAGGDVEARVRAAE